MTTVRRRTGGKILWAALLGSTALVATPAAAQSWKGTTSTDFNDGTNWSTNTLPGPTDTATIDTSTPNQATIDAELDEIGNLVIGESGSGTLVVDNAGQLAVRNSTTLGDQAGSFGSLVVTGANSGYTDLDDLAPFTGITYVGKSGSGSLAVLGGAQFVEKTLDVGYAAGSQGTVTVAGDGSTLKISNDLLVGFRGDGSLLVSGAGQVQLINADLTLGNGGDGTATITGSGSLLSSRAIYIGSGGAGTLNIQAGGKVAASDHIDLGTGSTGNGAHDATVTIDGAGSEFDVAGIAYISSGSDGLLTVSNRGTLKVGGLTELGYYGGAQGKIIVTDSGSTFTTDTLKVADATGGELDVLNGGLGYVTGEADLGELAGMTGFIKVDGSGSGMNVKGPLVLGIAGTGIMNLTASGLVSAKGLTTLGVTDQGSGVLIVDDGDFIGGDVVVGSKGNGLVELDHQGAFSVGTLTLGLNTNSSGLMIADHNALAEVYGDMAIGQRGDGIMVVAGGASLTVDGDGVFDSGNGTITLAADAGANGDLVIGATSGAPVDPGTVKAAKIEFGDGSGGVTFNHNNPVNYIFAPILDGGNSTSAIHVLGGATSLTADSSGFKGATFVQGTNADATLDVIGKLGGTVIVGDSLNGGGFKSVLTGTGTILGAVDIQDQGTLMGYAGETLTVDSLTFEAGSKLAVLLGGTTDPGMVKVNGDLALDGSVDVVNPMAFGAGVYRLIDYGGALTDNGMDIGAVTNGTAAGDLSLQTSVKGQVNLVYVPGSGNPPPPAGSYSFWDGDAAGNAGNSAIDGGDGTWTATSTNFTDATGAAIGTYDPSLVVFEGQAGVVNVLNTSGDIKFAKLQFASDGYQLQGDDLALDHIVTIAVGDGTGQGGVYRATINNVLTGTGGLTKTDLGTLILNADESYTGGTTIAYGILQLGNGAGAGSVTGDIVDNGTLAFDRTDSADPMYAYSYDGVISGTGDVRHIAIDTLTLTGVNTFTGVTYVEKGTLALGGNGSLATSTGVVIADGATFDIAPLGAGTSIRNLGGAGVVNLGVNTLTLTAADAQYSGSIQGIGGLHLGANGMLALTGTNTYTGGTTIDTGAELGVGDGGVNGSITGAVTNNGDLEFFRGDAVTFDGVISGSGRIYQDGSGLLTLTGINTYAGGTAIVDGTLRGSASSFGSGPIVDNAALIIDQPVDAVFNNEIDGAGTLQKIGGGRLNYTGAGDFSGQATVSAGIFSVNGALASAQFTVGAGATLGGNGVVGSAAIADKGTIAPGNSIGKLIVAGNLIQQSGSIYAVELTSTGQTDLIAVGGSATITTGSILSVKKLDAAPYVAGTDYVVLTAAGGVTGSYALTGDIALSNFLGLKEVIDPTSVHLEVVKTKSFGSAGKTPNENDTGGGLDNLPGDSPVVGPVSMLPDDPSAQTALDQLDGEIHASVKTAMLENERFYRDAAIGRLIERPDGEARLWGDYNRSWARNAGDGNAATMNRNASGYLLGLDLAPAAGLRIGVLGGYGHSDVVIPARGSKAKIDSYTIGFYSGARIASFGLRFGADYSWQKLDTQRNVKFSGFSNRLTAHYTASTAQGFADVGYRFGTDGANIEPFGQVAWIDVATDGFTEKGGAAALKAAKQSRDIGVVTLGLRGGAGFSIGESAARIHATVGWRGTTGTTDPDAMLSFVAGGGAFDIFGAPLAKSSALVDAGLDVDVTAKLRLTVGYSGQFAGKTRDNGVKAGLSLAF